MKVINEVWAETTYEQRQAFHRFTCLNSLDPDDSRSVVMIESHGESIDNFDAANVPVDIWLTELTPGDEDDEFYSQGFRFVLRVSNYMPRRKAVASAVVIYSDNKTELQMLVLNHILPLYKNAMAKINGILEGTNDHLYYWDAND